MLRLLRRLMATDHNWAMTVVRITVGVVFFAHGAQKMLGWFGGRGFAGTMEYFAGMHIPPFFGFVAICSEFFGGLCLIAGLLTRPAALGIFVDMVVAVALVHGANGFFMDWERTKGSEGYEYHLLVLAMTVALMIMGAGAASIDRLISQAWQRRTS